MDSLCGSTAYPARGQCGATTYPVRSLAPRPGRAGDPPSSLDTGSAGAPLAHWPGRGPSRLPAVGFVVVAAHYEAAPLRRELATPRAALVSRLPATGRLDPPLWAAASRAQPDQAKAKPANRTRGGRLRSARSLAELLAARAGPAMPRSR